ncbi:TIGR00266 family protein [Candidatus Contubernalis alkaliaceticus]|uniref:TIGR00266 family protein n=1 Tax=Candidatus Contubernalis alkaliaceticus TaxID=338645 RepID=UPI001F4BCF16|nr:TIGR00266 family protein [Candidatus Contubernalis alkalaceticus]UNC90992.1 TIGR00266 family protein [Candidatus Contubernalis alkalaceticus]
MKYKIIGTTMPMAELKLEKGERITAQPGAMKWMTSGIQMETSMKGGLKGALKRTLSGEKAFMNYFSALQDKEIVAFGHTFPGNILVLDLSEKSIVCQKRSFLCSTDEVELNITYQKKLGTAFFGGEGFVMQKLSGNGLAFVEIDGECVKKELAPGQTIKVETGAVAMFEESVQMNIERVKGFKNMFFGGEGMFLTTLIGPGTVWLQTMPIQNLAADIFSYLPQSSSK